MAAEKGKGIRIDNIYLQKYAVGEPQKKCIAAINEHKPNTTSN